MEIVKISPRGYCYGVVDAMVLALQTAKNQKRILLLVSDGFDTRSKIKVAQVEDLLKRSEVLLYAIGIDDDGTSRRIRYHIYDYMLTKLTNAGGGRLIRLYTSRNYDPGLLSELFVDELHQGYTMSYYPVARAADAASRNIEVQLVKPGARLVSAKIRLQRDELSRAQ